MEMGSKFHVPAALPLGKEPRYTLGMRLDAPGSGFGRRVSNPGLPAVLVVTVTELLQLLLIFVCHKCRPILSKRNCEKGQ
jgi:hypothetical protein